MLGLESCPKEAFAITIAQEKLIVYEAGFSIADLNSGRLVWDFGERNVTALAA